MEKFSTSPIVRRAVSEARLADARRCGSTLIGLTGLRNVQSPTSSKTLLSSKAVSALPFQDSQLHSPSDTFDFQQSSYKLRRSSSAACSRQLHGLVERSTGAQWELSARDSAIGTYSRRKRLYAQCKSPLDPDYAYASSFREQADASIELRLFAALQSGTAPRMARQGKPLECCAGEVDPFEWLKGSPPPSSTLRSKRPHLKHVSCASDKLQIKSENTTDVLATMLLKRSGDTLFASDTCKGSGDNGTGEKVDTNRALGCPQLQQTLSTELMLLEMALAGQSVHKNDKGPTLSKPATPKTSRIDLASGSALDSGFLFSRLGTGTIREDPEHGLIVVNRHELAI
jgi:hypothetical protein